MSSRSASCKFSRALVEMYSVVTVAAVILLFTAVSSAQSTFGEFVGTVKDPSGAAISGCTVTVKNLGTSATRAVTTDSSGSYTVVNLEPGAYEITMEAPGFQKLIRQNLQLLSR